ncbi:hypothetical protein [Spirillospora sp. NPDC047279]|uniref:hypothetical protein n=1 Tax=Spirillospora sp. NPDC047279 TaxID=3155478 RepID=UPI0033E87E3F
MDLVDLLVGQGRHLEPLPRQQRSQRPDGERLPLLEGHHPAGEGVDLRLSVVQASGPAFDDHRRLGAEGVATRMTLSKGS